MIIHDTFEQRSDEWYAARMGIPTASSFDKVKAGGKGLTRSKLMRQLAGEIITGEPMIGYSNAAMERGREMEEEARDAYYFKTHAELHKVAFITDDVRSCGASPDSLIGDDGVLEIKTKQPDLLIEALMRGSPPPEHIPQVQGQLLVTERQWCDLALYWPGLPLVVHRIVRDPAHIIELRKQIDLFNRELAIMVDTVRAYV